MNKEQLKEAVGELNLVDTVFEADGVSYIDTAVSVIQVYDLIDQLDEPEKVVIPKFAAEWIEKAKKSEYPLAYAINQISGELGKWLHTYDLTVDIRKNQELFAKAWVGGYEVEKEKLYCVVIPTKDKLWKYYYLDHDGGINMTDCLEYTDSHTEEFIRSISDDLWQFAVEVAE